MPNPATTKLILEALEAQLPGVCTSIRKAQIMPGEWFELLSPQGPFPLIGIVDGGATGDQNMDPISTYTMHLVIFLEVIGDPKLSVLGTAAAPGIIDLAAEIAEGMEALVDLGLPAIFASGQHTDMQPADSNFFDPDNPRRIALRKRLSFWFNTNEY